MTVNRRDDFAQNVLQVAQVRRDRLAVCHADIRPHVGVRAGNSRGVLEAAAD